MYLKCYCDNLELDYICGSKEVSITHVDDYIMHFIPNWKFHEWSKYMNKNK